MEAGRGNTQRPLRRMVASANVTASGPARPSGISPNPNNHTPGQAEAHHQPRRPPTCATTILTTPSPPHHDTSYGVGRTERRQPKARGSGTITTWEGATSTARDGNRPDTAVQAHQAKSYWRAADAYPPGGLPPPPMLGAGRTRPQEHTRPKARPSPGRARKVLTATLQ